MKISKEVYNGFLIFFGIGIYFLAMNLLGFADVFYLRLFNSVFVLYGVNKTLSSNFKEGKIKLGDNAQSGLVTALTGIVLSVAGIIAYSYIQGGDQYVQSLSKTLLFGGNPSVMTYSICLFFEGIASSVIITLLLLLHWRTKYVVD